MIPCSGASTPLPGGPECGSSEDDPLDLTILKVADTCR